MLFHHLQTLYNVYTETSIASSQNLLRDILNFFCVLESGRSKATVVNCTIRNFDFYINPNHSNIQCGTC